MEDNKNPFNRTLYRCLRYPSLLPNNGSSWLFIKDKSEQKVQETIKEEKEKC